MNTSLFRWHENEKSGETFNTFLASDEYCHLRLITFANNFDQDQGRQNVGPDLEPKRLTP